MPRKKTTASVNPVIEKALNTLLAQVLKDPDATLTDKMKVLDRSLKWEAIKMKAESDEWGTGFNDLTTEGADDDDATDE